MQRMLRLFSDYITTHHLSPLLARGAILGLSGGADSVLLLHLLCRYRGIHPFPLYAVHVHHGIRGDEADTDAKFCETLCKTLDVSFVLGKTDVPFLAKSQKIGIEECARTERYRIFAEEKERLSCALLLTAHHANDQAETVFFHLMRGSGMRGLCGMSVYKNGLFRPLLSITKEEIREALYKENIAFRTDQSNEDISYTRNYLRHEIMPRLASCFHEPEKMLLRLAENMQTDASFIEEMADGYAKTLLSANTMRREGAKKVPDAILYRLCDRAFHYVAKPKSMLKAEQMKKLSALIRSDKAQFSFSLSENVKVIGERDNILFTKAVKKEAFCLLCKHGENLLPCGGMFLLTDGKNKVCESYRNIYKLSNKANLSSAKIVGELSIRNRKNGDKYRYGGMTRSVATLFSDRKMTQMQKDNYPILCDEVGILWIPGFGVRSNDEPNGEKLTIAFYTKNGGHHEK